MLDFNEKFLTVRIHNLHDTIKKLYYYPPKWKKVVKHESAAKAHHDDPEWEDFEEVDF